MLVGTPFTAKWPWVTIWRAAARDGAKPRRNTTLSSRSSSDRRRDSPVTPEWREASTK